eukprot:m.208675 g.208675  ORF g.208675 m.208675 type:complete len:503 (-) comp16932_c1_seq1:468-1976(-)
MDAHVSTKDFAVMGSTLRCYLTAGSGVDVVLLHDGFSSSLQFKTQLNGALGRQLRLIAFDLPGHGASRPALDIHKHYTTAGMAVLIAACLQELGIRSAFVVGSGLGAHVGLKLASYITVEGLIMIGTAPLKKNNVDAYRALLARAPAIAKMSELENLSSDDIQAVLHHYVSPNCLNDEKYGWLSHAVKHSDARFRNVFQYELERNMYDELELIVDLPARTQVGIVAGAHDHLVSFDYISSLEIPKLWRQCVQVVPGAYHLVAAAAPNAFEAIVRDLIKDARGALLPVDRKVDPATLEDRAGMTGGMTHPQARFESSQSSDSIQGAPTSEQNTPMQQNPYARGKVPGGTMPHPSMRFECTADELYAKEPVVHNPDMAKNPYARGRVKGGVMPHPSARFEGGATEIEKEPIVQNPDIKTNPYARGRVPGGVMPHPSARFETPPPRSELVPTVANPEAKQNPFARGRVPGGVMPHPSSRFEGHPIDRPSTRVRQPPGGHSHNILG